MGSSACSSKSDKPQSSDGLSEIASHIHQLFRGKQGPKSRATTNTSLDEAGYGIAPKLSEELQHC